MTIRWLIVLSLLINLNLFSVSPPSKPPEWDNWTFNKKILWRGVNLDPRIPYGPLVDKLVVKKIVEDHLPTAKTFFATNAPSQINLENLPSTFMMKANNASSRGILVKNGMVISTRKRETDFVPIECSNELLRSYAQEWLTDLYKANKEMQYGLVKPMILFEEYLEDTSMDVELYFFNGKMRLISLFFIEDYTKKPMVSFYDENWNLLEAADFRNLFAKNEPIEKPPYIDKLISFGECFAEKIDHVRIDFFVSRQDVYFGEFTFTTGGGNNIDCLNSMIGNHWDFPDPADSLTNPYLNDLIHRAESESDQDDIKCVRWDPNINCAVAEIWQM